MYSDPGFEFARPAQKGHNGLFMHDGKESLSSFPYLPSMINRILLFFFLVLPASSPLSGQDQYSREDCISFVQIYMEHKEMMEPSTEKLLVLLDKHGVDKQMYSSFIREHPDSRDSLQAESLRYLLRDIRIENERMAEMRNQMIRKACRSEQLPYGTYQEMHRRYKSEIAFQRSLKPYFERYINFLK